MRRNHFFVQKTAIWGENVTVLHGQLYLEKSTAWNSVTNWIKCQTGCQYLFLWLIKTSIRRELEGKVICTQDQTRITTYHTSHQFLRCVGLNNSEVCQETLIFLPQSCRWILGMWVRPEMHHCMELGSHDTVIVAFKRMHNDWFLIYSFCC